MSIEMRKGGHRGSGPRGFVFGAFQEVEDLLPENNAACGSTPSWHRLRKMVWDEPIGFPTLSWNQRPPCQDSLLLERDKSTLG